MWKSTRLGHARLGALLCLAAGIGGWAVSAQAAPREIRAASASVADIQAAADQLGGEGIVRVPDGRVEAVGTLRIRAGVSVIGAGREKSVLFRGPRTGAKDSAPIVEVDGSPGKRIRISGIGFVGVTDPQSASWDSAIALRDCLDFRVDNCCFERFGAAAVSVRGLSRGVVDHCRFVSNFKKAINNVGYGVVVMGTGVWRPEAKLGSADAVYIEDCELIGSRHAVASNAGAHYVFRHNHVHGNDNSQAVDCHGPGYGSKHGTQWIEVYDNLIERPVGGSTAMVLRGGGGVVFGNTMRHYRQGIQVTLDFDAKVDWSRPYPIPEQVGDMWFWGNTLDGKDALPVVPARSANHIQLDRDYFNRPKPGYQPFTYPHPLTALP